MHKPMLGMSLTPLKGKIYGCERLYQSTVSRLMIYSTIEYLVMHDNNAPSK